MGKREIYRIIDANLDRIGEGLRVLEDIARLALNNQSLSQELKNIRHQTVAAGPALQSRLLQSRRADRDVGMDLEAPRQHDRGDLAGTVTANAKRVQEALRVVEELARQENETGLKSETFRHARFALYTVEKDLVARVLRQDKISRLFGLYVIIDSDSLKGRSCAEVAMPVVRGGARVVQMRDKPGSRRDQLPMAVELKRICADNGVLFIVNDYLDLALAVDADGVHLGQDDLPVRVARDLLPLDKIIGVSVTTPEQAAAAGADGADYVAVSAIYPTVSKDQVVVGLAGLRAVRQSVSLPLIALGGINKDRIKEVVAAGADSVAVISAVLGAPDVAAATRELKESLERAKANE